MKIRQKDDANETLLEFEGDIDEDSVFPEISRQNLPIALDLDRVSQINSCGIREWIRWIKPLGKSTQFLLRNCPRVVIDQINTVSGFIPANTLIESFKVPYFCGACEKMTMPSFQTKEVVKSGDLLLPGTVPCADCKKDAEMDVIPERYFKFLQGSL